MTMVWEERWHPLREEWVIVAAHRQNRPWSGGIIEHAEADAPNYVPDCYLCPGNMRVSGKQNLDYTSTFVFDNDLPSVSLDAPGELPEPVGIYRNRPARGIARVVCYIGNLNEMCKMIALKEGAINDKFRPDHQ